jgi:hypothetical protein
VSDRLYVSGLYWVYWGDLADAEKRAFTVELESRYRRGLSEKLIGTALFTLAKHSPNADYRAELVTAYREGRYGINSWAITALADDSAITALTDAVQAGGPQALDAIAALGTSEVPAVQERADEEVLRYLVNGIGDVDSTVRVYIENRIRNSQVASPGLMTLVRHLIARRDVEWTNIMATLLVSESALRHDPEARSELLREYLATADAPRMRSLLHGAVNQLKYQAPNPELTAAMATAMAALDPDEVASILLQGSRSDEKVASYLGRWLEDGTLPARGPWLTSVRDHMRAGKAPGTAVNLVFDAWLKSILGS